MSLSLTLDSDGAVTHDALTDLSAPQQHAATVLRAFNRVQTTLGLTSQQTKFVLLLVASYPRPLTVHDDLTAACPPVHTRGKWAGDRDDSRLLNVMISVTRRKLGRRFAERYSQGWRLTPEAFSRVSALLEGL